VTKGSGATNGWRFTDDHGTVLELEVRPRRVIAYVRAAASLWEGGARPIGVFGSPHDIGWSLQGKAGGMDLSALTVLGCGAEVDLHRYAALRPDLLVSVGYGGAFYGVPAEHAKRMADLAPVLFFDVGPGSNYPKLVERFTALAHALRGARPTGLPNPVDAARQRFDVAAAALREVAKSSPARVLALSGANDETAYVANPEAWPELAFLTELGVDLVSPDVRPGGSWATLTWRDVAGLDADVVLHDNRPNALDAERLAATAGWSALPAVAAGRAAAWNPELPCGYGSGAAFLENVADVLTERS
jgi:iron complex transport system substrate-binding protein